MTFHTGTAQVLYTLTALALGMCEDMRTLDEADSVCVPVWWKSMKQLLPSKLDGEECVRYSATARAEHQRPRVEPAGMEMHAHTFILSLSHTLCNPLECVRNNTVIVLASS